MHVISIIWRSFYRFSLSLFTERWEWDMPNKQYYFTSFANIKKCHIFSKFHYGFFCWVVDVLTSTSSVSAAHIFCHFFSVHQYLWNPWRRWDLILFYQWIFPKDFFFCCWFLSKNKIHRARYNYTNLHVGCCCYRRAQIVSVLCMLILTLWPCVHLWANFSTDLCVQFARQMYFAAISMQIAFENKTELV